MHVLPFFEYYFFMVGGKKITYQRGKNYVALFVVVSIF